MGSPFIQALMSPGDIFMDPEVGAVDQDEVREYQARIDAHISALNAVINHPIDTITRESFALLANAVNNEYDVRSAADPDNDDDPIVRNHRNATGALESIESFLFSPNVEGAHVGRVFSLEYNDGRYARAFSTGVPTVMVVFVERSDGDWDKVATFIEADIDNRRSAAQAAARALSQDGEDVLVIHTHNDDWPDTLVISRETIEFYGGAQAEAKAA